MDAFRIKADGKLKELKPTKLRGIVDVDPRKQDFFRIAIEERQRLGDRTDIENTERKRLDKALKVLANAASYGIYAEMHRLESDHKRKTTCYGIDPTPFHPTVQHPDEPGAYCFPPMASLIRVTAPNGDPPPPPRPVDPRVLEAYLQGNYHLSRYGEGSGEEELKKASEYFQQAIASDPNFALAYLGVANAHGGLLRGSSEDAALVKRNLEKAVELDPNSSDAQAALGFMKWQPYLDWRGAEEHLRRAIALNPNNADARYKLGLLLIVMGRADAGLRECQISQQLDPNSDESSMCFFDVRDYDSSMAVEKLMLEKDPSNGFLHCFLFNNYYKKGMQKEAVAEMAACWRLYGFAEGAARIEHALAVSGPRVAMQEWARVMEGFQATRQVFLPGNLAVAYTILGDKDRAFYWLEQAYEHREMVSIDGGVFFLGSDPMYDPLRSDPRYKDLLRRVGLPQ